MLTINAYRERQIDEQLTKARLAGDLREMQRLLGLKTDLLRRTYGELKSHLSTRVDRRLHTR